MTQIHGILGKAPKGQEDSKYERDRQKGKRQATERDQVSEREREQEKDRTIGRESNRESAQKSKR